MTIADRPTPVFWFELRASARRGRIHLIRVGYALVLMILAAGFWRLVVRAGADMDISLGRMIERARPGLAAYLTAFQMLVALLAGPAAAAGALGQARRRGLLGHALLTDLSAAEIVLGTAAARLANVLLLMLAGVPMMVLAALLGAIGPAQIAILGPAILGTALLGVSAATGLSLWTRRPHEAIIALYGIWAGWFVWSVLARFPGRPPNWWDLANPFILTRTLVNRPLTVGPRDALAFLAESAIASSAILAWTTARLRAVLAREGKPVAVRKPGRGRFLGHLPGPTLDGNPVLLREWRHGRRSRWGRIVWAAYALIFAYGCIAGTALLRLGSTDLVAVVGFGSAFGLLAATVGAASCWDEERAAGLGGLDVLLATPLSASTIVIGKWWASYRVVPIIAMAAAIPTFVLAVAAPTLPAMPPGFGYVGNPAALLPLRTIDRAAVVAVVVARVLADGAALVALGVWLATRCRKTSTAVVAAVAAFVFVAMIVPTAAEVFLLRSDRELSQALGTVSPLGSPIVTLASMFNPYYGTARGILPYQAGWLIASASTAAAIRWRTIRTFDRTMGRMPDGTGPISVGARRRGPGR